MCISYKKEEYEQEFEENDSQKKQNESSLSSISRRNAHSSLEGKSNINQKNVQDQTSYNHARKQKIKNVSFGR